MALSPDAEAARQALPLFGDDQAFRKAVEPANATALRTLLSAASAAEIPEEIDIVLRYQAARGVIPGELLPLLTGEIQQCIGRDPKNPMPHIVAFLGQVVRLHKTVQPRRRR